MAKILTFNELGSNNVIFNAATEGTRCPDKYMIESRLLSNRKIVSYSPSNAAQNQLLTSVVFGSTGIPVNQYASFYIESKPAQGTYGTTTEIRSEMLSGISDYEYNNGQLELYDGDWVELNNAYVSPENNTDLQPGFDHSQVLLSSDNPVTVGRLRFINTVSQIGTILLKDVQLILADPLGYPVNDNCEVNTWFGNMSSPQADISLYFAAVYTDLVSDFELIMGSIVTPDNESNYFQSLLALIPAGLTNYESSYDIRGSVNVTIETHV